MPQFSAGRNSIPCLGISPELSGLIDVSRPRVTTALLSAEVANVGQWAMLVVPTCILAWR